MAEYAVARCAASTADRDARLAATARSLPETRISVAQVWNLS